MRSGPIVRTRRWSGRWSDPQFEFYGPVDGPAQVGVPVETDPETMGARRQFEAEGEVVDVGGRRGVWQPEGDSLSGERALSIDFEDVIVGVLGTAAPEVMETIGAGVSVVDGAADVDGAPLPDDWEHKGSARLSSALGWMWATDGFEVSYQHFDPQDATNPNLSGVVLLTWTDAGVDIDLSGLFPGWVEGRHEVGGAPAKVFTPEPDPEAAASHRYVVVAWSPEPGVRLDLALSGPDADVDAALGFAETARPVTEAERAELPGASPWASDGSGGLAGGDVGAPGEPTVPEGEGVDVDASATVEDLEDHEVLVSRGEVDGWIWTMVGRDPGADDFLEIRVDGILASGITNADGLGFVTEGRGEGFWLIGGRLGEVPAGTVNSVVVDGPGGPVEVEVAEASDGGRVWVASADPEWSLGSITILDEDGEVLGTFPMAYLGAAGP